MSNTISFIELELRYTDPLRAYAASMCRLYELPLEIIDEVLPEFFLRLFDEYQVKDNDGQIQVLDYMTLCAKLELILLSQEA